jgi:hypothetical protein
VFAASIKVTVRLRAIISAALLLFVFFLPLHVHASTQGAKLSQECSCVLGQRTQMALTPAPIGCVPTLASFAQPPITYHVVSHVQQTSRSIRAPPAL